MVEDKPQKKGGEDGLVGRFLTETVRRYKNGGSGSIMKRIGTMNYLVFDRNLFNSLKAGGIQKEANCSTTAIGLFRPAGTRKNTFILPAPQGAAV